MTAARIVRAILPRRVEDAIVIAAEVTPGQGALKDEPVTVATLRGTDGREHHVRIVGGPTRSGGFSRVAGHVVPVLGARVRMDLREVRRAPLASLPGPSWIPNVPNGAWSASALPLVLFLAPPT